MNIENSLAFASAIGKSAVTFELHVYDCGQHGFSTAAPDILAGPATPRLKEWVPESLPEVLH